MTSDKLASAYAPERRSPCPARDLIESSYRLPAEHKISDPAQGKRGLVHENGFWLSFCDAATLSNRLEVTVPAA